MKALTAFLAAAALAFSSPAVAQDGGHTHPSIEAKNAEQDAALLERAQIDAAIGLEVIDLKQSLADMDARIKALEEAGPPVIEPDPPTDGRGFQIQGAFWYPTTANPEEPYINIIHASRMFWTGGGKTAQQLIDEGYIDPVSQLPKRLPGGTLTSDVYFTAGRNVDEIMPHWDGEWVLEWDGDADLSMLYVANNLQRKVGDNRLEFTRDFVNGKTLYHAAIQIKRLDSPLTGLRMFRKENEDALKAGKVYNPKSLKMAHGYDVLRTMDLQLANQAIIRKADQVATSTPYWGGALWKAGGLSYDVQSMPLSGVFALGVETGAALWTHAPITLGMVADYKEGDDVGAYRALAKANAKDIIKSPEWDKYADAYVKALIESGYPSTRPLYTTVANEVWNFAGQYHLTTNYAWGIGEGLAQTNGEPLRAGYGALMARWKLALDGALKRAGRTQSIVYVIEGQAAYVDRTRTALEGAKAYMASLGEDWADHADGFGVSVASYWGAAPDDLKRDGIDPNDFDALENWFLTGPKNSVSTLPWILENWKGHAREADKYGVKLIGAYEGGSHFERPSDMPSDKYQAFLWGERGGRINRIVNEAIIEEFPDVILSNYVLAGPKGAPWFEGLPGDENPYSDSWKPFLKP